MSKSKYLERYPELVRYVQAQIAETGYTPSAHQLSQQWGWPKSTCHGYLQRLRAELTLPPARPGYLYGYLRSRQPLLKQIQDYTDLHGFAPSLRSLASATGLSPNTLRSYLHRLRQEGLVDFDSSISRSLRLKK